MFSRPLIAIDIGSTAIKVVELTGARGKTLRSMGVEVLPYGSVVDGEIKNIEEVERGLRSLLKRLRIKPFGRRAALAVSGSSVLIKKAYVEASGQSDEQIRIAAEQQFNVDMNEVYYDSFYLESQGAPDGTRPVIIAGAKREMLEPYLGLMRQVGLRTGVVECSVFSATNMFEFNYGRLTGLVGLVNIGASFSQVTIIHNGEFIYSQEVPVGGEEYTRKIMEAMSIDRANAEALKVAASHGDGGVHQDVLAVIQDLNNQLVGDVQMAIDTFFASQDPAASSPLNAVYLTGGGARTIGLDAALAATLQIPVQVINPFQKVEVDPKRFKTDFILMQGHLYGVAVGLGMRAMGDGN